MDKQTFFAAIAHDFNRLCSGDMDGNVSIQAAILDLADSNREVASAIRQLAHNQKEEKTLVDLKSDLKMMAK